MRKLFTQLKPHLKPLVRRLKRIHKHPLWFSVSVFFGLVVVSGIGLLIFTDSRPSKPTNANFIVILSHDHQQQAVPTDEPTVAKLLQKLRIKLNEGDRVEPSLSTQILQDNFRVNIYRAVPVVVSDGTGQQIHALSAATTPRSIASQAGVTIYPEDIIKTTDSPDLLDGTGLARNIAVARSTPVNLNLYGTQITTRTQAKTVGGLVAEKKIKLVDGATLNPTSDTPLTAGVQVFVLSKGVRIASVEQTVPAPQQNIDDNNLTLGSRAVRQVGSAGVQVVTYQITVDATGKEIARTVIQTVVTQDPVPQIVAIGKHVDVPQDKVTIMQAVGIAPGDYGYVDYIVSHEGGWAGTTKSNYSGSGAYGICQALPGSKMASAGADWATNPVTQLRWCNGYAVGKYGSWYGAYTYWYNNHYW